MTFIELKNKEVYHLK